MVTPREELLNIEFPTEPPYAEAIAAKPYDWAEDKNLADPTPLPENIRRGITMAGLGLGVVSAVAGFEIISNLQNAHAIYERVAQTIGGFILFAGGAIKAWHHSIMLEDLNHSDDLDKQGPDRV